MTCAKTTIGRLVFDGMLALLLIMPVGTAFGENAIFRARAAQQKPPAGSAAPSRATLPDSSSQNKVQGYHLSPAKYAQAVAYSRAGYRLYFISTLWGFLVLLLVLLWRLGPRLRDLAIGNGGRRRFVQALLYTPPLLLAVAALMLPADLYGHWLSLHYQQSVEGWPAWSWDWTKQQLLGWILGVFLVWILYGVQRRSPRRWWFYFWLISIPIVIFLMFIEPVVIEPLFYKFEPLQPNDPALVAEISKVVARAGLTIPPSRMFEMKASEKTNELNAYVTGIGASKRVVVWDTTIEKMTVPETVFVFGHEMGHYVLGHIWKGIAFIVGVLFVFLYIGFRGMDWAVRRWGEAWRIRGVDDLASLPLLLLFVSVLTFVATPIITSFVRHQEEQADTYGMEVIHGLIPDSHQVAAQAFQILGEVDLSDPRPSPFIEFWLYDHPPIEKRIEFALHYDPWSKGGTPKFVK
ncbi:MAG TPA: M48 family metallopeptidase [Terriglobia bacterium]|nr:M48 family metallopeptidase [Terriglobia bacterium]